MIITIFELNPIQKNYGKLVHVELINDKFLGSNLKSNYPFIFKIGFFELF